MLSYNRRFEHPGVRVGGPQPSSRLGAELVGQGVVEFGLQLGITKRIDAGKSCLPLLLDVADSPDDEGHEPGDDEESDDREADVVEIEGGGPRDRTAGDVQAVGEDREDLDGSDD